jgi:hypothetical protein
MGRFARWIAELDCDHSWSIRGAGRVLYVVCLDCGRTSTGIALGRRPREDGAMTKIGSVARGDTVADGVRALARRYPREVRLRLSERLARPDLDPGDLDAAIEVALDRTARDTTALPGSFAGVRSSTLLLHLIAIWNTARARGAVSSGRR